MPYAIRLPLTCWSKVRHRTVQDSLDTKMSARRVAPLLQQVSGNEWRRHGKKLESECRLFPSAANCSLQRVLENVMSPPKLRRRVQTSLPARKTTANSQT